MSYLDDFFDRRRSAGKGASAEDRRKATGQALLEQRDKALSFKKYFGTPDGQAVMLDLMNKFHVLNELPETDSPVVLARAEGARSVVIYLLKRAKVSMDDLDKILKGEFV
jgi:hypothetical protein